MHAIKAAHYNLGEGDRGEVGNANHIPANLTRR
jgi:hypothetical protein